MPKITEIKETKRGRLALFADGEFIFSVDAETMAVRGIHEGSVLDEGELSSLRDASDTRRAADAALRYLSLRAYGERELYEKLLLKYDEHSAAAAIAKMCDAGLLDDETFTAEKAKGMAQRGKSPLQIRQKLYSLGLDRNLVDDAVNALDIDGTAAALAVLQKGYTEKLRRGEREKVMAALARRGFSHREIRAAITAVEEAIQEEEAQE